MVFSSHIFLFYFLPLSLAVYFASPFRFKSLTLCLLSYVFYGWWNPWFVFLMFGSTVVDYGCGLAISSRNASAAQRKGAVLISVASNLAVLAFFKYASFIAENIALLGLDLPMPDFLHRIVLPVGISFYTFQSMSYTLDLYRGDAPRARNFLDFAAYVSMFPQLVAGPIIRYRTLADQLRNRRHSLDGFVAGATRFCYGLGKKVLVANHLAPIADSCFSAGDGSLSATAAWIGILAYAFQIYFDFSAYSDMAFGLGRMLGFRFPENFSSPYQSRSITEFWRRWHISLSSFLRDYLYIPLGGNRKGLSRAYANLLIVMIIGGLWHGAQWTFVCWGCLHGIFLVLERAFGKRPFYHILPAPVKTALTFVILLFTWVFFRSPEISEALRYISAMLGLQTTAPSADVLLAVLIRPWPLTVVAAAAGFVWLAPNTARFLEKVTLWKVALSLFLLVLSIRQLYYQESNPFLYFQF